jgi:cohesin loading factor subunit SCC2
MLKLLERSVRAGEDVEPYRGDSVTPAVEEEAPNSSPKKKGKKTKSSPQPEVPVVQLSDSEIELLDRTLDTARDSVLAAEAALALLCADRLAKHLYSEELIGSCLSSLKNALARVVYPSVEASSSSSLSIPLAWLLLSPPDPHVKICRDKLNEVHRACGATLLRVDALVRSDVVSMSDALVIQAVYVAIGPFFVVEATPESTAKGKKDVMASAILGGSAMKGLRLDALSLIRSVSTCTT